jgi:aryl-alcohol dehydrogenase-like predicted oxidoreductase
MTLSETCEIAPGYVISRIIRGGWQLAGGHGAVERDRVTQDLAAFYDAGITTFDCADIYTGVEEMIGDFRATLLQRRGPHALDRLKVHTKFVPDIDLLPAITALDVRRIIDRSLQRLRMERLDLVQFHWWDYAQPRYVDTALHLRELQAEGKIHLLSGTNFDAGHVQQFADAGVNFSTMQVQYSLLDHRPAGRLTDTCRQLGTRLLCYGTLAGGFLSESWLGKPEPTGVLTNRSRVKYKLIIDEFGGWELFQSLLETLRQVAERHGASIANVASCYVLELPLVAGVIVGASHAGHLEDTIRLGTLKLTAQDRQAIGLILAQRHGPEGEVYALERDRNGPHGAIMKYNLGDAPASNHMTKA